MVSYSMAGRRYEAVLERRFAAPRLTVWGLVSDTNRWDRASGLKAGRYTYREHDGQRKRIGQARELGFDIEWVEPAYGWVEGRFVHGERLFLKGPVGVGGFSARLDDVSQADGGGTRVTACAYIEGDGAFMPVIGAVMRRKFRRALGSYLQGLGEVLAAASTTHLPQDGTVSATLLARELIADRPYDELTQGPRSPTSLPELDRRASRLAGKELDGALLERVTRLLRERPDEEVAQIRPFELADRWQADRRELLRVFLHATRAGMVDLRWQINCPVCRVAAQVVGSLADVTGTVHCAACNIGYDVDFGRHIEAVFQCHPAIRTVQTSVYCASSPAFLPHVVAQLSVLPGKRVTERADLRPGTFYVRALAGGKGQDVDVAAGQGLAISVDSGTLSARAVSADDGIALVLESSADTPRVVLLERSGVDAHAALGSVVASFSDFLDLFATEAPATGVELTIAHLALLFSDLTGSTALYGQVGDARAFAIVQEHFRDMTEVVVKHHGAVVKTMGDAVMASFTSETDAVAAAIEMLRRCRDRHGSLGVSAKLGVGAGPCLAVRANDHLDYFGTTVNLSARLQARADSGQLVVTRELGAQPAIQALIAPYGPTPFKAALKGIATEQDLLAVSVCVARP
jgi:class 3 adenylate cyclase